MNQRGGGANPPARTCTPRGNLLPDLEHSREICPRQLVRHLLDF